MASTKQSKKMRILLIPFFATSHIGPYIDFAVRLAVARPGSVKPSVVVTPANITVVRSALERHGPAASGMVKIVTYPFPCVDGLAPGMENLSTAGDDAWRINAAAIDEALSRPAQEALLRELSPDAVVTDYHFFWNSVIAAELGLPCVGFSVSGPSRSSSCSSSAAPSSVTDGGSESHDVVVPRLPGPEIRIPVSELPEFLRRPAKVQGTFNPCDTAMARCLGVAFNTFADLEQEYHEARVRVGSLKRCYFVGPVSLPLPPAAAGISESPRIRWLDSKPSCSVVYVCFGGNEVLYRRPRRLPSAVSSSSPFAPSNDCELSTRLPRAPPLNGLGRPNKITESPRLSLIHAMAAFFGDLAAIVVHQNRANMEISELVHCHPKPLHGVAG